jgi:hypothetical protein
MTITVYYAVWGDPRLYGSQFLSNGEPYRLLDDIKHKKNTENKSDNFLNCPAFVNSVKNTYVFTSPLDIDCTFEPDGVRNNLSERSYDENTIVHKNPTLIDARTIKFRSDWIFFCEEELFIHSTPPFLHKSAIGSSGYYVPGTFDISSWFRPLEYAFQMWDNVNRFVTVQDDPVMYVNFLTDHPVQLQKFWMTPEIFELSMSCIRLKSYRKEKNLLKLYDIFRASKIRNRILRLIKENQL